MSVERTNAHSHTKDSVLKATARFAAEGSLATHSHSYSENDSVIWTEWAEKLQVFFLLEQQINWKRKWRKDVSLWDFTPSDFKDRQLSKYLYRFCFKRSRISLVLCCLAPLQYIRTSIAFYRQPCSKQQGDCIASAVLFSPQKTNIF